MDMCPEYERYEREHHSDLSRFEILSGEPYGSREPQGFNDLVGMRDGVKIDHDRAVKKYHRPAAGNEEPFPDDVRPIEVLERTIQYLMKDILDRSECGFIHIHNFIRDRARAVRQDLTLQNIRDSRSITLHEQMTRFHIISNHILFEEDVQNFNSFQNMEQLKKILQSLSEMYEDFHKTNTNGEKLASVNECEFRSYYILSHLRDDDILNKSLSFPRDVFYSKEVQFSLTCAISLRENNYYRFFKLIEGSSNTVVDYCQACLLECYFNYVRVKGFGIIHQSYNLKKPNGEEGGFPGKDLINYFGFNDENELILFCTQNNIRFSRKDNSVSVYPDDGVLEHLEVSHVKRMRNSRIIDTKIKNVDSISSMVLYTKNNRQEYVCIGEYVFNCIVESVSEDKVKGIIFEIVVIQKSVENVLDLITEWLASSFLEIVIVENIKKLEKRKKITSAVYGHILEQILQSSVEDYVLNTTFYYIERCDGIAKIINSWRSVRMYRDMLAKRRCLEDQRLKKDAKNAMDIRNLVFNDIRHVSVGGSEKSSNFVDNVDILSLENIFAHGHFENIPVRVSFNGSLDRIRPFYTQDSRFVIYSYREGNFLLQDPGDVIFQFFNGNEKDEYARFIHTCESHVKEIEGKFINIFIVGGPDELRDFCIFDNKIHDLLFLRTNVLQFSNDHINPSLIIERSRWIPEIKRRINTCGHTDNFVNLANRYLYHGFLSKFRGIYFRKICRYPKISILLIKTLVYLFNLMFEFLKSSIFYPVYIVIEELGDNNRVLQDFKDKGFSSNQEIQTALSSYVVENSGGNHLIPVVSWRVKTSLCDFVVNTLEGLFGYKIMEVGKKVSEVCYYKDVLERFSTKFCLECDEKVQYIIGESRSVMLVAISDTVNTIYASPLQTVPISETESTRALKKRVLEECDKEKKRSATFIKYLEKQIRET